MFAPALPTPIWNAATPRPIALAAIHRDAPTGPSILIVDDDEQIRHLLRQSLRKNGYRIGEADNGVDAISEVGRNDYDVLLLDLDLPRLSGQQVLDNVRRHSRSPHLKVLVISGHGDADCLSETLHSGADDFLTKPFSLVQLKARIESALRLKKAQDHADTLNRAVARSNAQLESALTARDGEIVTARHALVLAMAKLVECRSKETGPHLMRVQLYCRALMAAAAELPQFESRLGPEVRSAIEQASPLHDIGKVSIPDAVLNKPGKLTPEEFEIMKGHARAGSDTLEEVCSAYGFCSAFLHTAAEIARHHHEKWDGRGYPDALCGEAIPLSARVVALADVYDALRSPRVYKKGYAHAEAVRTMLDESPGHFDPGLLEVFERIHGEFESTYDSLAG